MTSGVQHPFRCFNDESLKAKPLSQIVHSTNRLENMRRYTRALCNVTAAGKGSLDQVDFIQSYLSTKLFLWEVVDSVGKMFKEASGREAESLIDDAVRQMDTDELSDAGATLLHDAYRVAALDGFQDAQMSAIAKFGEKMGIDGQGRNKIFAIVEQEQRVVGQYAGATSKAA